MYIERNYARRKGDNAILKSPLMSGTGSKGGCFEFWYNMNGYFMETLNVILESGGGSERKVVWSLSGDQGKDWHKATIPIGQFSDDFSVSFLWYDHCRKEIVRFFCQISRSKQY